MADSILIQIFGTAAMQWIRMDATVVVVFVVVKCIAMHLIEF